jgi:hypothetical protein
MKNATYIKKVVIYDESEGPVRTQMLRSIICLVEIMPSEQFTVWADLWSIWASSK